MDDGQSTSVGTVRPPWWRRKRFAIPLGAVVGIAAIGAFGGPPEDHPVANPSAPMSAAAPVSPHRVATPSPATSTTAPSPTQTVHSEASASRVPTQAMPVVARALPAASAKRDAKTRAPAPKPAKAAKPAPKAAKAARTPTKAARPAPKPARPVPQTPKKAAVANPVTPGAFCSRVGATGLSKTGKHMKCSMKPTNKRARWRAA